jgi:hypothetical protein
LETRLTAGRLRVSCNGVLDPTPIAGVLRVRTDGNALGRVHGSSLKTPVRLDIN